MAAHTPGLSDIPEVWLGADGTPTGEGGRPIPNGRQADEDHERPNGLLSDQTDEDYGESQYRVSLDGATTLTHAGCPPTESLCGSQAKHKAFRVKSGARVDWYTGTWNVRSLLDNEGSIETARQGRESDGTEDRRIDLVLRKLGRFRIKVAALQETKWFGNAEYYIGRSIALNAGRPTLETGQHRQREV